MFEKFVCSRADNSIKKNSAWETNGYSNIEEVPCLLWNVSMHSLSWTWWVCSLIPKLSFLQDFGLKFCISFWYLAYIPHVASHLPWFDHSSNAVPYLSGSNHYSLLVHLIMLDTEPMDQLVPTAFGRVGRSVWVIDGACWCFFMMRTYLLNTFPIGDVMRSERSSLLLHFQRRKQFTDIYMRRFRMTCSGLYWKRTWENVLRKEWTKFSLRLETFKRKS